MTLGAIQWENRDKMSKNPTSEQTHTLDLCICAHLGVWRESREDQREREWLPRSGSSWWPNHAYLICCSFPRNPLSFHQEFLKDISKTGTVQSLRLIQNFKTHKVGLSSEPHRTFLSQVIQLNQQIHWAVPQPSWSLFYIKDHVTFAFWNSTVPVHFMPSYFTIYSPLEMRRFLYSFIIRPWLSAHWLPGVIPNMKGGSYAILTNAGCVLLIQCLLLWVPNHWWVPVLLE